MSNNCGQSAWHNTADIYGGIGQQTIAPGGGNLIATRGGKGGKHYGSRSHRKKRSSTKKYSKGGKKKGSRKVTSGKNGKKKIKRGGGCGCGGATIDTTPAVTAGSAQPAPSLSNLLTGSFSA